MTLLDCCPFFEKFKSKKRRLDEKCSSSISSERTPFRFRGSSRRHHFPAPPIYKAENGEYYVAFFTKRFVFSNHFECPNKFTIDGAEYPTSEHYYMYRKALFHGDAKAAEEIRKEPDPKVAKRITSGFRNFDSAGWDAVSVDRMREGVMAKFEQNAELRQELFKTGNATLVEAAPMDKRWGVGLARDDRAVADPARWLGQNLLGQILMGVRTSLATQFPEEFERQKAAASRYLRTALKV